MSPYAAIDFGTSNSAVAVGRGTNTALARLEDDHDTLPTAVFYNGEESSVAFGRQAIREYKAGYGGRLLRSLKSLLGSELVNDTTVINGRAVAYRDIISQFLSHLKAGAEKHTGAPISRAVLGRPVQFVDGDAERDRLAESTLREIAQRTGFSEIAFQFEPIAAALDYESQLTAEQLVLVADIGGGTSDFSLVRLGPSRRQRADRSADVLGNDGVHLAGTDFDQQLSLHAAMPALGLGSTGPGGKAVPAHTYFELATWHKINFLYAPRALAEAETLRVFYGDPRYHARLMRVLREREGHRLAGLVEEAKISLAQGSPAQLDLDFAEDALTVALDAPQLDQAVRHAVQKIADTARATVQAAGLHPQQVDAIYFTGGSTGLPALRAAIAAPFPHSTPVLGDPFASVARGLGAHAATLFG